LIALLKEARRIVRAHRRPDLQHNGFLQRVQDAIDELEKHEKVKKKTSSTP
jgi:signal transduction histidine kinase